MRGKCTFPNKLRVVESSQCDITCPIHTGLESWQSPVLLCILQMLSKWLHCHYHEIALQRRVQLWITIKEVFEAVLFL